MCLREKAPFSFSLAVSNARYSKEILTLDAEGQILFSVIPLLILPVRVKFTPYFGVWSFGLDTWNSQVSQSVSQSVSQWRRRRYLRRFRH